MEALKIIGWFIGLGISLVFVFEIVGLKRLVEFFPEGKRWWIVPAQWLTLIAFAGFVLFHPFG